MWQLWQEPFMILGALTVFEILRRFDSKKSPSFKQSVLNVVIPSLIVIGISFLGDQLF